jgi:GNAT superfamily N-acetyltransferase
LTIPARPHDLRQPHRAANDCKKADTMTQKKLGATPWSATVHAGTGDVQLRRAVAQDVPALVALLSADTLGRTREAVSDDDLSPYKLAFEAIDADPAQLLVSVVDAARVVGTMQLSFIPGLSRRGALRAQIEAVRVHEDYRNQGLGEAIFEWAISEARRRGCALVQLTTDKRRTDAHRFYARLGFVSSHEGLKLQL